MILGQSGGPTSVINASAAGVFIEALNNENITHVYAASHGIKGILNEEIFEISKNPKVSMIIPLYNTGELIKYVVRSIQNQNMEDIEIY